METTNYDGWSEEQLSALLLEAEQAFHDGPEPIMSDTEYDYLLERARAMYPSSTLFRRIGAAPSGKNKTRLPFPMPSLNKIKPSTGALGSWMVEHAGPYVLSAKLDGVSGLYVGNKLFTRGDGMVGQDISTLIPFLRLPMIQQDMAVRGEFIMRKDVFESRYIDRFANARNLVTGIVNRIEAGEEAHDLYFVAYEVIRPSLHPSVQLRFLADHGFDIPLYRFVDGLSDPLLSNTFLEWREEAPYDIDGVVVVQDRLPPSTSATTCENPRHAFAFKSLVKDQVMEARVVAVHWRASKDGYLKPRVQIEPVCIGGVTIEYATGFNAAFIRDRGVGEGARIRIARSGDVIPHILEVVEAVEPMMPSTTFRWSRTGVDAMVCDGDMETHTEVVEKRLTAFFRGIGAQGMGSGNVARLVAAGKQTIPAILRMRVEDFQAMEGFQETLAIKIHRGIHEAVEKASLPLLMSSSNLFGRGISDKKIAIILQQFPDVLVSTSSVIEKKTRVAAIHGMADITAQKFVEGIPRFLTFLHDCGLEHRLSIKTAATSTATTTATTTESRHYVFTGVRDKALMDSLRTQGATFGDAVTANTTAVITKSVDSQTAKMQDARRLHIPIFTLEEFKSQLYK